MHRCGTRTDPANLAAIWRYRSCFTPDDAAWAETTRELGRAVVDRAVDALIGWAD